MEVIALIKTVILYLLQNLLQIYQTMILRDYVLTGIIFLMQNPGMQKMDY